jgi:hypothetical protein
MKLLFVTDSVEELTEHIRKYSIEKFGLVRKEQPKWWFGEKRVNTRVRKAG